jgi:hypothetical protein
MEFTVLMPVHEAIEFDIFKKSVNSVINSTLLPSEFLIIVDGNIRYTKPPAAEAPAEAAPAPLTGGKRKAAGEEGASLLDEDPEAGATVNASAVASIQTWRPLKVVTPGAVPRVSGSWDMS